MTIRGRFRAAEHHLCDLVAIGRSALASQRRFSAVLHGPSSPDGRVHWYELSREDTAFTIVRSVHDALQRLLRESHVMAEDETSQYDAAGFRPHMTISLERQPDKTVACRFAKVRFVEWGLFRYVKDTGAPDLQCMYGETLRPE